MTFKLLNKYNMMHMDLTVFFLVCVQLCIVCVSVCSFVCDNVYNKDAEKKVSKVKKKVGDACRMEWMEWIEHEERMRNVSQARGPNLQVSMFDFS